MFIVAILFFWSWKLEENKANVIWQPFPGAQADFLKCPYFEILLTGNRGSGKSDVLIMKFLKHVGQGFGQDWKGLILREQYRNLKDIRSKSLKWIPPIFPDAKFNFADDYWKFSGGEELHFNYANSDKDYYKYHGFNLTFIAWEELTNHPTADLYLKMMTVIRKTNPDVPKMILSNCNPSGPGHNWVKQRFKIGEVKSKEPIIESEIVEGKIITTKRCYITSKRKENRFIMENDPEYEATLMKIKDPNLRKAWLEGSWDIVAGGMFDDLWDREIHVLPRLKFPQSWYFDRSFDYGLSHPFSVDWYAMSDGTPLEYDIEYFDDGLKKIKRCQKTFPKGTIIRFWELYGCKVDEPNVGLRKTSREIGEMIKAEEALIKDIFGITKIKPGPADSSIFDSDHRSESIALDINSGYGNTRTNHIFVKADKSPGSRKRRWAKLRDLLNNATIHPMENPSFFVTEDCKEFIRTVPTIPRKENDLDDIDSTLEDHILDSVGYRLLHKPIINSTIKFTI
ncbi:MAG: terminase [Mycoplasma sp.]|nr:terminase [Mycoplasma sp.]